MITQQRLKEVLRYRPDTGVFTWKKRTSNRIKVGDTAGTRSRYVFINVDGKKYRAHRLAWLYVHGRFPAKEIDHINHNGLDNRLINLRECDHPENHRNESIPKNNKSGTIGVFWDKSRNKWLSNIRVHDKTIYLGYFTNKADAIAARQAANIKYNFHPNHGR